MMRSLMLIAGCLWLVSCTAPANPPSLLPRAIEQQSLVPNVVPVAPSARAIDPTLAADIARLVAAARAGDEEFAQVDRSAGATIATGRLAPSGSESWIAGQVAQSALEVARQRTANALAEIDGLVIMQSQIAMRDGAAGGMDELQMAQTQIEAAVARQDARLNAPNR